MFNGNRWAQQKDLTMAMQAFGKNLRNVRKEEESEICAEPQHARHVMRCTSRVFDILISVSRNESRRDRLNVVRMLFYSLSTLRLRKA